MASLLLATAAGWGHVPIETYVEAAGPAGPLKGTMLSPLPAGGPILLMVPGSGPVDRDGDSPPGLKAAPLRLLAQGLAAEGIATVRIDKRGMYGSAGATPDANAVTIGRYAADVRSWAASIRHRTGARCIWVLGHSEGGLVALAAAQDAPDICGLVLIATAGRPIGAVIEKQLRSNPANAPILDQALAALKDLAAGRHVDPASLNPALLPLFRPAVQDFLIDEMALDPTKLIATLRQPVLIVQGTRDMQVSVRDAELLKQANPAAALVILADTNHVLKTVTTDDRGANLATYGNPGLPLAPGIVSSIAKVVKSASP